jgi:hypothetical protein
MIIITQLSDAAMLYAIIYDMKQHHTYILDTS